MNIKEIALRLRNENPQGIQTYDDYLVWFAEALVAEIQRQSEPVAFMRKWVYDKEQPKKVKNSNGRLAWPFKFKLVPVSERRILKDDVALFTFQPDKAQIEQRVAEACAEVAWINASSDCEDRVKSAVLSEYRKFIKE